MTARLATWVGVLLMAGGVDAQGFAPIEDESKVPPYTLPDPLVFADGSRVATAADWPRRRVELIGLFEDQVYGRPPGDQVRGFIATSLKLREMPVLEGKGIRKEYRLVLQDGPTQLTIPFNVYLPRKGEGPFPTFLGLNFEGNHAVDPDPRLPLASCWFPNRPGEGYVDHKATEKSRGGEASRWPLELILGRGYAVVTACYNDIDPDYDDGFANGVHALVPEAEGARRADAWGSVAGWAFGLSLILDELQRVPGIDAERVAVWGHSRLGKAALWAGATDPRFALVVSNESGCGGAALSKRVFGETVGRINTSFPHWFCDNFNRYNENEAALPVDQHELIALIAPRPVLICSAAEDLWADPRGEFLAAKGADSVYRLLGTDGLAAEAMPEPLNPIMSRIGYQVRPGKHDVTADDWKAFMDFADIHMNDK